tara:strand:+ start:719 stop:916 length:198 start_codon:yes stop_codon:yes gene_type:complete
LNIEVAIDHSCLENFVVVVFRFFYIYTATVTSTATATVVAVTVTVAATEEGASMVDCCLLFSLLV